MVNNEDLFKKGATAEDWDKLTEFLETNDFTISDMLAVVCAVLCNTEGDKFKTMIGIFYRLKDGE